MKKTITAVLVAILAYSTIKTLPLQNSWHDSQRVLQLTLLIFTAITFLLPSPQKNNKKTLTISIAFLTLILISKNIDSVKEVAVLAGLFILSTQSSLLPNRHQTLFIYLLCFLSINIAWQFFFLYTASIAHKNINADLLYSGFSNPRFLAQFQTLFTPLLSASIATLYIKKIPYKKTLTAALFISLTLNLCLSIALASRGMWASLIASYIVLAVLTKSFRRQILIVFAATLIAALLYIVLFIALPEALDFKATLQNSMRFGLSKRDILWQQAWDIFIANPWLGVGPMNFSATFNPVAAHPHQMILQWLAEFGLPITLLLCALIAKGMWHGLMHIRGPHAQPLDAALWVSLCSALILAQVDGVFVMPYTQTWLAILAGIAWGRWAPHDTNRANLGQPKALMYAQTAALKALCLAVIFVLSSVLLNEVPTLKADSEAHMAKHGTGYTPRFWMQGWIPMERAAEQE